MILVASSALAGVERPNIILILSDDQGWNGTSVQMDPNVPGSKSDYYLTPHLEALAERGMRFSRAYSAAPLCQPTRASIQTGMSPAQLQYTNNVQGQGYIGYPMTAPIPEGLPQDTLTIARWLNQHRPEYISAHVGKWHLPGIGGATGVGYAFGGDLGHSPADPWGISGLTNMSLNFMQERVQNNEPFFLQLSHRATHTPIRARQETIEMFENLPRGTLHQDPAFAAMTYDLDWSLGRVLDAVREMGIEDNTYVIFVADNGAWSSASRNTPLGGGKQHLLEGGIRVPMVIAGPGVAPGAVSHVPVITTDFLSTISELVGIDAPLPAAVEGTSFAPVLHNGGNLPEGMDSLVRAYGPQGELFFHNPHNFAASRTFRIRPMSAVIRGDWKLLKIWGEGEEGSPEQLYLTNLATGPAEPTWLGDNIFGNQASQHPELVAELDALLMNWLEGVDASFAYDVKEKVELHWDAGRPGDNPRGWRSTIDVNYKRRETWTRDTGQAEPKLVDARPFQPGLPTRAFHFDGNDRMVRKYFHVSDMDPRHVTRDPGTPDFDRSATFEFWLRLDALDREQVLFESGVPNQGLSITIGDGNADGIYDHVRMRVLGDDGQVLSVTARLNEFSNPTRDFVHLVAVLDDSPDNRFAEIYVNGASMARAEGLAGPEGSIRWDGFSYDNVAGLGRATAEGLGGASGTGDLPFAGGGLRGDLAVMRFFNYAITAADVHGHYNSALDPVGLGVARTTGDVRVPSDRPNDVSEGAFESSDTIWVIQERTDVLDAPLTLDFAVEGVGGDTLPAGTAFTSYLLHFDPLGHPEDVQTAVGGVTFAAPILGVLFEPASLAETHASLGSIGRYSHDRLGFVSPSVDGFSLSVLMSAVLDEVSQIRVLTEAAELALSGDYNGDLRVDQADLDLVLLNWGTDGTVPPPGWQSNLPGGLIGQAQLDGVLLNWGRQLFGAAVAVPEPSAFVLISCGAPLLLVLLFSKTPRKSTAMR